ncbi:MAG: thioredoxin family protein [bacterium]
MKKETNNLIILFIFLLPLLIYFGLYQVRNKGINFISSNHPKVIDFSSKYCLECEDLDKVLTPLEKKYEGKIDFIKIDITSKDTESQKLIKKYNVQVVPTLVLIDKNKKEKILNGYMDDKTLDNHLKGITD